MRSGGEACSEERHGVQNREVTTCCSSMENCLASLCVYSATAATKVLQLCTALPSRRPASRRSTLCGRDKISG